MYLDSIIKKKTFLHKSRKPKRQYLHTFTLYQELTSNFNNKYIGNLMSHFLFDLIKSLTKSEKIYFKRYAKFHAGEGEKNYLKIYDAIEGLKTYDKEVLPKLFKGTSIEKYQNSEVKYLNDKILLSLSNYNLNKSKRNKLQKGILMLEALSAKGLKKEALKKLRVLKANAYKQEEFTAILRLIELEEIILFKQGILGYKDKLEELGQQRTAINTIILNQNKYHMLRQEVREFQFSEHLFKAEMKILKDFKNQPLIKNIDHCLSKKSTEHWYYINVLINYLQSDFKSGLSISYAYVNFITKNIHLFDHTQILPAISNYIYHSALTRNKEHFENGINLLLELSHKKEYPEFYIKYILYTRNLEFAYYTNDVVLMQAYLELAIDLVENNTAQYEEAQIQYIYFNIVKSAIILKDHSLGMYHCNLWHQRGVMGYRKVQARIFSLILHFEVNYIRLMESEIITLKKLAKNNEREKDLIRCFYTFFNTMIMHPKRREISINKLQNELKIISQKKNTSFSFVYFHYYEWSLQLK
ncbi:hypothetical protein SCB49_11679 [unidentified eubacterium SCB49]|nr:hypothetical protein SCB49_11679 [unidentified eubacterium SCB49]